MLGGRSDVSLEAKADPTSQAIVGQGLLWNGVVLDDVRITAFVNSEPLNLSPAARRAGAERLVERNLIRHEMDLGRYPDTEKREAEQMLENFRNRTLRQ